MINIGIRAYIRFRNLLGISVSDIQRELKSFLTVLHKLTVLESA